MLEENVTREFYVLSGDTNGDRTTNDLDLYRVWQNLLKPPATQNLNEDLTGDGKIDASDLSVVRSNYLKIVPAIARMSDPVLPPSNPILSPMNVGWPDFSSGWFTWPGAPPALAPWPLPRVDTLTSSHWSTLRYTESDDTFDPFNLRILLVSNLA